jgi:hypothetical protein
VSFAGEADRGVLHPQKTTPPYDHVGVPTASMGCPKFQDSDLSY